MKKTLLTICCLLVVSVPAFAEDLDPPPYRGLENSTTQEWDFLAAGPPPEPYPPDGTSGITNNPYGNAELYLWSTPGDNYLANTGPGPGGAWALAADACYIFVPNGLSYEDPSSLIRIQVTFYALGAQPGVGMMDHDLILLQEKVIAVPGAPEWSVVVQDWRNVWVDGGSEVVVIWPTDSTIVSEIVIDTVPEPSFAALLVLGILAIKRRR